MAVPLSWPTREGEWERFVQVTQLQPDAAYHALLLGYYAKAYLNLTLQVTSSFRDSEYQTWLRNKCWPSLKCRRERGLKVRPAAVSQHSSGRAFDVGIVGPAPKDTWARLGALGEQIGLRWGGRFSTPDPVHFDLGG